MTKKTIITKNRIINSVKFIFVFALLFFLVKKGFVSVDRTKEALTHLEFIIPAFLATAVTPFLTVIRWQWLLRAQKINLSWTEAFQLCFVGNFFNIALPGAVSGDFVKAFYIGQKIHGERSRAFGSILFDRVAGLSALVLVSCFAFILGLRTVDNSAFLNTVQIFVGIAGFCVLSFFIYLFIVKESFDPLLYFFRTVEKTIPKLGSLTRIYESIRQYHHHRWIVAKALLLSIFVHLIIGWSCLTYAQALGEHQLSLLSLYIVVPLGLLVTTIPVGPAGFGTGNLAFLSLFHLLGSERGADVYSLYAFGQMIIGAFGGLVYLKFQKPQPQMSVQRG